MLRDRPLRRLAALGAAGILLAACGGGRGDSAGGGGETSPGITDTEVTLGGSYPLSGPASAYATINDAVTACFDKVNDQGGVEMADGQTRQINFISYDDAYEPSRIVENARRLVEQDQVFALFNTLGTPGNTAIIDYMNEQEVPHLFLATGASKWGADPETYPWTIGWQPAYSTEAAIYAEYLKQENPDATVAVLYQNDDYGEDYLSGFKEAIAGSDIEIVDERSYQVSDPSVDSQVTNLAQSDADVFFNITTPKFATQAIARKHEIGWDALQLLNNVSTSIESVLEPAGLEAAEGAITAAYIKEPSDPQWEDDPTMQQYFEDAEEYGDFNVMDPFGTFGFAVCDTMVKVLEDTQEPTRAALMEVVRSMDYEIPLLLPDVKVKTGEGDSFPIETEQLQRFNGETWELFGDTISYEGQTPIPGS